MYVAIPLLIIITCYTKVFITVRKHNLNFQSRFRAIRNQPKLSTNCTLSVGEVNVTYMLLAVVVGFLICWIPVLVIDLIDFINGDWKLERQVYVSKICFAFASTSLNPVIYGIMNRSFRAEYLRILAALKVWTSKSDSDVSDDHEEEEEEEEEEEAKINRRRLGKNKLGKSFEMEERKPV